MLICICQVSSVADPCGFRLWTLPQGNSTSIFSYLKIIQVVLAKPEPACHLLFWCRVREDGPCWPICTAHGGWIYIPSQLTRNLSSSCMHHLSKWCILPAQLRKRWFSSDTLPFCHTPRATPWNILTSEGWQPDWYLFWSTPKHNRSFWSKWLRVLSALFSKFRQLFCSRPLKGGRKLKFLFFSQG